MQRLAEKYRPRSLDEIVGQFPVRVFKTLVLEPYPSCWLLEAAPGVGKTATGYALGAELGCVDEFSGLHFVIASELSVDKARELFQETLRLRPLDNPSGWHLLLIDELETLSPPTQTFLKPTLENLPGKVIVVATSNGAGKLQPALLERFTILRYDAGQVFAIAAQQRLREIWQAEFGSLPLPHGWQEWGRDGNQFSLRRAMDTAQAYGLASSAALAVA